MGHLWYIMNSFFGGRSMESARFYAGGMILSGIVTVLVAIELFPRLQKVAKDGGTFGIGVVLRAAGYCGAALAPDKWSFLIVSQLFTIGDNLMQPPTMSVLTEIVDPSIFGTTTAIYQAFQAMARVFGPLAFGLLYDRVSYVAPFYAVALLSAPAAMIFFHVYRDKKNQSDSVESEVLENVSRFMSTPELRHLRSLVPLAERSRTRTL